MSKLFWCEIPGCNRSETFPGEKRPFPRKDKRDEHMKRPHKAPDGHDAWIGTHFDQLRTSNANMLGTGHSRGPVIIDALSNTVGSSGADYSTGLVSIGHTGQPNVAVPSEFFGSTITNYPAPFLSPANMNNFAIFSHATSIDGVPHITGFGETANDASSVVATRFPGADGFGLFAGYDEHIGMQGMVSVGEFVTVGGEIIHDESGLSTGDPNLDALFLADDLGFTYNAM